MRFYVLILCQENEMEAYVFSDGFVVYTPQKFKRGSLEKDNIITTGYIDRKVYERNPLTHQDLRKYLDNPLRKLTSSEIKLRAEGEILSNYYFHNAYQLISQVIASLKGIICSQPHKYVSYQLFGFDLAPDESLGVKMMEANKGPDMGAKDGRDGALKQRVMDDILKVLGIIEGENGFIKVYDSDEAIII